MSDLDRRTLDKLRVEFEGVPDEQIRKTYRFAFVRLGLACQDMDQAIRHASSEAAASLRRIGGKRGGKWPR